MIYFLLSDESFTEKTKKLLASEGTSDRAKFIDLNNESSLSKLYQGIKKADLIVLEAKHPTLPTQCWLDLLFGLSLRLPLVCIERSSSKLSPQHRQAKAMTWLSNPTPSELILILNKYGFMTKNRVQQSEAYIPYFNPLVCQQMLQRSGFLSLLSIHTEHFQKIGVDFGPRAYSIFQEYFQTTLFNLWGRMGKYRANDILCKQSPPSKTFLIILEKSRRQPSAPEPGVLENLADRLSTTLHSHLWGEISKTSSTRSIPDCITTLPKFSIGHATILDNHWVDRSDLIESLLERSREVAQLQQRRTLERQRELVQSIIHRHDVLTPHYQAIFHASTVTKQAVTAAMEQKSIAPLAESIYGFESLVRVNGPATEKLMKGGGPIHLETKYLRPDILFSLAETVSLTLELDQTCLWRASEYFGNLPGVLLINILPRNFHHIEKLKPLLAPGQQIIFEISESEAINNFDFIEQARKKLGSQWFKVAIDDFGKGHASIDRVIHIKPDIIKLDRCLVHNIHLDSSKLAFVRGLLSAAKITNAKLIAEGIESLEEINTLKSVGIDYLQGFLLHRPIDAQTLHLELNQQPSTNIQSVA